MGLLYSAVWTISASFALPYSEADMYSTSNPNKMDLWM